MGLGEETKADLRWASSVLIFLVLAGGALSLPSWNPSRPGEGGALEGKEEIPLLSHTFFKTEGTREEPSLLVAFEGLSVVLLAALLAALALARREGD